MRFCRRAAARAPPDQKNEPVGLPLGRYWHAVLEGLAEVHWRANRHRWASTPWQAMLAQQLRR